MTWLATSDFANIEIVEISSEGEKAMSDDITVEESSDNVFADLGYPDSEEALVKSRLAQRIAEILEWSAFVPLVPFSGDSLCRRNRSVHSNPSQERFQT